MEIKLKVKVEAKGYLNWQQVRSRIERELGIMSRDGILAYYEVTLDEGDDE